MIELLKLLISKDFISNAKDIVALMRRSKDWKKDIIKFSGQFYLKDKLDSSVLVDQSIQTLRTKTWNENELQEVRFILNELFANSFTHGMPSKERSFVSADITISSSFFKLSISDFGLQFDLLKELREQEAFNPQSDKHRGLSFINKLTPEIYQENKPNQNTVIVIKRKGLKPLRVYKLRDILIFEVGNSTYVNDINLNVFVDRINSLTARDKVVIDFGSAEQTMISTAYRNIRENLIAAKTLTELKISVCGLSTVPFAIRDYFQNRFATFDTIEEAIAYHDLVK